MISYQAKDKLLNYPLHSAYNSIYREKNKIIAIVLIPDIPQPKVREGALALYLYLVRTVVRDRPGSDKSQNDFLFRKHGNRMKTVKSDDFDKF
jgi:hypothetical protein